jgi:hypothetical protein
MHASSVAVGQWVLLVYSMISPKFSKDSSSRALRPGVHVAVAEWWYDLLPQGSCAAGYLFGCCAQHAMCSYARRWAAAVHTNTNVGNTQAGLLALTHSVAGAHGVACGIHREIARCYAR